MQFIFSFGAMDHIILHEYGNYPEYKIEERITFALRYANLYLAESDDEGDIKSFAANIFHISCVVVGYSYSLWAITVSISATSDVVFCWIFTSALFLTNYTLSNDYMVYWDKYSMLGIGSGYTNIDEGSLLLHN